jgi:hypothetical protein
MKAEEDHRENTNICSKFCISLATLSGIVTEKNKQWGIDKCRQTTFQTPDKPFAMSKTAFFFRRRTHSNVLTLWRGPRLSELYVMYYTHIYVMYIKSKSSQHEQISRKNSIASGSAKGWELSAHLLSHFCQRAAIHIGSRLGYACVKASPSHFIFYKKRPSRNLEYIEEEKTWHERTRETLSAHTPEIKEFCFILYCIDARALCYICCLGGCHSHSLCACISRPFVYCCSGI